MREFVKYGYIDALRGIAVLMVIVTHVGVYVPPDSFLLQAGAAYGHLGVQLFFVVSAFTLTMSATRRREPFPLYLARRYFRIFPLYLFGVLLYALIFSLLGFRELDSSYLFDGFVNIFLVHGFFPEANNSVVPGGWSIGTEMIFYWAFPLVLYFSQRFGLMLVGLLIFLFSFLSLISYANFSNTDFSSGDNFYYHSILNQLPIFYMGIFCFQKFEMLTLRVSTVIFIVFTFFALAAFSLDSYIAVLLKPLLCAISFIGLVRMCSYVDFSRFRLLIEIGQRSFSMYILHFIFAKFAVSGIPVRYHGDLLFLVCFVASVYLTYVMSGVTKRQIEDRAVRLGGRFVKRLSTERI